MDNSNKTCKNNVKMWYLIFFYDKSVKNKNEFEKWEKINDKA